MSFKLFSGLIAIMFLFSSCETDFKTTADYKEIPVIYGFLNPYDSVNYLKINKAFIGEGNALLMAQQYDSINYPVGKLEIWMERTVNGIRYDSVPVSIPSASFYDTTTSIPKNNGIFSSPLQLLYQLHYTFPQDNNSRYTIHVKNIESGVSAKATTALLSKVTVTGFSYPTFNFTLNYPVNVYHSPATYGKEYDFILRFHYREINTITGAQEYKSLDWNFPSVVYDYATTTNVAFTVNRPQFYSVVGDGIEYKPNTIRRVDSLPNDIMPMEAIFFGGTDDLYQYNYLNTNSTTLIQERPIFNNIDGGIGLFTSLYRFSIYKGISSASLDSLATNYQTSDLNFQH